MTQLSGVLVGTGDSPSGRNGIINWYTSKNKNCSFYVDWNVVPNVNADQSSSFVLDRIKPVLKNLIGSIRCNVESLPPDLVDDDVITRAPSGDFSAAGNANESQKSDKQENAYCFMRSCE